MSYFLDQAWNYQNENKKSLQIWTQTVILNS